MAPPTQAPGQEAHGPADPAAEASSKRKPGRRDPERRRQQNLRAQKRHREKARERLARLEALHGHAIEGALDTASLDAGARDEDQAAAALDAWDPVVHVDPFLVHRRRGPAAAAAAAAPLCTTAPLACNCGHAHATLVQTQAPAGAAGSPPPTLVVRLGRRDGAAADPYANHVRVEALCTIAALQAAGAPLGMCTADCARARDAAASPFARPGAGPGPLRVAARLFASLPRDLRPGAAQLARPHAPAIDALPFPTLRHNLVALAGAAGWGPLLEAFFFDLLVGLVCWAGGDGGPRPWEARAWEARPWFLRKYWALLGGEAGELVRQSAWWRTARGEFAGLAGA